MIRFKDDIAEAQERSDAWWNNKAADRALIQIKGELDKPIFSLPAPEAKSLHDWWTNPDVVVPRVLNRMGSTWYGGEAFPILDVVPGRIVSITCKYLGAPNKYIDESTTWSVPIINDWADSPSLEWNEEAEWWEITKRNLRAAAEAIRKYDLECFIGHPDLNGPTEILAGLRNPENLTSGYCG